MERKRYPLDPNIPPSEQLKQAKRTTDRRMGYLPHIGAKQIAKAKKRAAKAAQKNKDLT